MSRNSKTTKQNNNLKNKKSGPGKSKGPLFGLIAAFIVSVIIIGLLFYRKQIAEIITDEEKTIYVWYSDEALTNYLNSVALSYYDEKGVKVVPVLHTSLDYLETIGAASVSGDEVPDLYIAGTDMIERAAMTGLAIPVSDSRNVLSTLYYPQVALDAVTYKDEPFGYPFYYDTSFLLYNKTYLRELAAIELKKELALQLSGKTAEDEGDDSGMADLSDDQDPMAAPEGVAEEMWNNAIDERLAYFIPSSIQDIQSIASRFAAPGNVESFLYWDVSDIFYTYYITGAYMDLGGAYGDDINSIDICNENTIRCMAMYQILNQYFSIDSANSKYEDVLHDFIKGKYIYTIVTTDAIAELEKAKQNGEFVYDYDIAKLPGVDSEHVGKGLSYTNAVIINGFTANRAEANDFAAYLAYNSSRTLYERTGKMPAATLSSDYGDKLDSVRDVYASSVQLPKIIELSNFWMNLEQAYTLVWDGEDPETVLKNLEDNMKMQLGR